MKLRSFRKSSVSISENFSSHLSAVACISASKDWAKTVLCFLKVKTTFTSIYSLQKALVFTFKKGNYDFGPPPTLKKYINTLSHDTLQSCAEYACSHNLRAPREVK